MEAVYLDLAGVTRVLSGYTGGAAETANYRAVCGGATGHAEAVEIHYDPTLLSFGRLLQVFFAVAHDPTQHNRQGNDVGIQYRSAIFTRNDAQGVLARDYVAQLNQAGVFEAPIATEITPLTHFYPAEDMHQDYARRHPDQPYICAASDRGLPQKKPATSGQRIVTSDRSVPRNGLNECLPPRKHAPARGVFAGSRPKPPPAKSTTIRRLPPLCGTVPK